MTKKKTKSGISKINIIESFIKAIFIIWDIRFQEGYKKGFKDGIEYKKKAKK